MKTKLGSVRDGSKKAPGSQPQKPTHPHSRGLLHTSATPSLVLFRSDEGVSDEIVDLTRAEYAALKRAAAPSGSGILMFMANAALALTGHSSRKAHHTKSLRSHPCPLCLYDMEVGEFVTKIPLANREFDPVLIAALGLRITVGQFIADAIKEKLAACECARGKEGAS